MASYVLLNILLAIDVLLEIPEELFLHKDFLRFDGGVPIVMLLHELANANRARTVGSLLIGK